MTPAVRGSPAAPGRNSWSLRRPYRRAQPQARRGRRKPDPLGRAAAGGGRPRTIPDWAYVARTTEPAFEELRQTEERSVETIKAHMRNLFRKLDVSSRVEVARTM
jgi:hypothetical protein